MNDALNNLRMVPPKDPTREVLMTDVDVSEVNWNDLRMRGYGILTGLIERSLSRGASTSIQVLSEIEKSFPQEKSGFSLEFVIDWAKVSIPMWGQMTAHFYLVTEKKYRVWILAPVDREVELGPDEDWVPGPNLWSDDFNLFFREFSKHPNHGALIAFQTYWNAVRNQHTSAIDIMHLVRRLHVWKKNLLPAVLARSRKYQDVETVLFNLNVDVSQGEL